MLDQLYKQAAVIARHRAAPRLADRERFLVCCAEEGYSLRMLRKIAWSLFIITSYMPTGEENISRGEIERLACLDKVHVKRRPSSANGTRSKHTSQILVKVAIEWYSFLGLMGAVNNRSTPFDSQIAAFERFMRDERGLSEVTIENRRLRVGNCLKSMLPDAQSLGQVNILLIDNYLQLQNERGWCRSSLAALASDLRCFFRYAEGQGWCATGLAAAIESPRLYSDERLPAFMAWADVKVLITSLSGNDAVTMRDRAIVLLLANYGFRRGEVARLKLEDIDWEEKTLEINRSKQRRIQCYPLIQAVGDALIQYLTEVRPRCSHREVFLAMKAPLRPLSAESITQIVRWRSAAIRDGALAYSPHNLRHACAQHLLTEGFSLKKIGDQLGHRSATSTVLYAKIDLPQLRQVAEIDLGEIL